MPLNPQPAKRRYRTRITTWADLHGECRLVHVPYQAKESCRSKGVAVECNPPHEITDPRTTVLVLGISAIAFSAACLDTLRHDASHDVMIPAETPLLLRCVATLLVKKPWAKPLVVVPLRHQLVLASFCSSHIRYGVRSVVACLR
jgi:hypothetical protein